MNWKKIIVKNKKKLVIFFLFLLLFGVFLFWAGNNFWFKKEITVGIVADIHAGNEDNRDEGLEPNNILHPADFETNLKTALAGMKNDDLIIALGDDTNTGSAKYSQLLKKITASFPLLWVKGNHDTGKSFAVLTPKKYYYKDIGKWRVIVLDNSDNIPDPEEHYAYNPRGYISEEQMSWLKYALQTDRYVLIAMHVPIFDRFNIDQIAPEQKNFQKMLGDSGNVKYVLAGHFHIYNIDKTINKIRYLVLPSLELDGREGYFINLTLKNN